MNENITQVTELPVEVQAEVKAAVEAEVKPTPVEGVETAPTSVA